MRCDGRTTDEGYVALQAWLVGQLDPRTPHAADLFAQDSECLYDAFLSVLVGTRLGFADYDDIKPITGSTSSTFSSVTSRRAARQGR